MAFLYVNHVYHLLATVVGSILCVKWRFASAVWSMHIRESRIASIHVELNSCLPFLGAPSRHAVALCGDGSFNVGGCSLLHAHCSPIGRTRRGELPVRFCGGNRVGCETSSSWRAPCSL